MGRPSKLTPETHAKIVEAILYGASYNDAAGAAGVHYDTFNNWMLEGKEAKSGKYFEFFEAVNKANAECAINFSRVIQTNAAKGDWKAALEWLKRRRPADWGDKSSVDLSNSDGTLKPEKEADDTRAEILRKLASIATATGADKLPEQPKSE